VKKKSDTLVAVGIPVYNGSKTINRLLNSIINQSYKNIEIIISDNCSTDKTLEICETFKKQDDRITIYRQNQNIGVAKNFNYVYEKSRSKYFMWAAADDYFEKDFIFQNLTNLENNPKASLSQSKTNLFIEGNNELIGVASINSFKKKRTISDVYFESLFNFPATAIYGLYRSEILKKTDLWRNTFSGDLIFIQQISLHGYFVEVEGKSLFNYVSRDKWKRKEEDYFDFYNQSKIPIYFSPFLKIVYYHFLNIFFSHISIYMKFKLMNILLLYSVYKIFVRFLLKINKFLVPKKYKSNFGLLVYWKFIFNKNLEIKNYKLFYERFIYPQIHS